MTFIHLFLLQTLTELLSCVRYCARYRGHKSECERVLFFKRQSTRREQLCKQVQPKTEGERERGEREGEGKKGEMGGEGGEGRAGKGGKENPNPSVRENRTGSIEKIQENL